MVRADPRYARALAFDPSLPPGNTALVAALVVAVAGAVALGVSGIYLPGLAPWIGIASGVALAICIAARVRELRVNARPLVRVVAVVIDKRTEVVDARHHRRHHHVATRYGTTLQLENGQRFELETFAGLSAQVAAGDVGVAYTRDGYLIGFDRFAA